MSTTTNLCVYVSVYVRDTKLSQIIPGCPPLPTSVSVYPCMLGIPRPSRTSPGCPPPSTLVSEYPRTLGIPRPSQTIPGCPPLPTSESEYPSMSGIPRTSPGCPPPSTPLSEYPRTRGISRPSRTIPGVHHHQPLCLSICVRQGYRDPDTQTISQDVLYATTKKYVVVHSTLEMYILLCIHVHTLMSILIDNEK